MRSLQSGERLKFDASSARLEVHLPGTDACLFLVDEQGKLLGDEWLVFYNNPRSPDGAAVRAAEGVFDVNLARLDARITRVALTATVDGAASLANTEGHVTVTAGETYRLPLARGQFPVERGVILAEVYKKNGEWRLMALAQGYPQGLDALVRHYGGEVEEPAAAPPAPTPRAAPAPAAPAAPTVSLVKQRQVDLLKKAEAQSPAMVSLIKTAAVSLEKRGLGEARYRVKLVLDISGSMSDEWRGGLVQALVERALALAARLDDDGDVEVYLFGVRAQQAGRVSLTNFRGYTQQLRFKFEYGTDYAPAMQLVRDDARREHSEHPVLVLFVTDGETSNRNQVERQIRDAAHEPIFWKFMAIQNAGERFAFLEKLDDLKGRVVDNADFFSVRAPIRVSDEELFDKLVNELDTWDRDARRAGILR